MTKVIGDQFYILAKRNDRSWGHGIYVAVYDLNDNFLGELSFVCHPDFDDFEEFQSYSSIELIENAMERIKIDLQNKAYEEGWSVGLTIILRINDSNPKFNAKIPQ